MNFESAPFKFTREYMELLDGLDSNSYRLFEDLFLKGFKTIRKYVKEIETILFVSLMVLNDCDFVLTLLPFHSSSTEKKKVAEFLMDYEIGFSYI
jgi:hypothetical protein